MVAPLSLKIKICQQLKKWMLM